MPQPKRSVRRHRSVNAEPLECRRLFAISTLLGWEMTEQTAFGTQGLTAASVPTGVTNSLGLTRGSGVTTTPTAAGDAWGGNGWSTTTATAGITASQFVTFGITVGSGYTTSLSSIGVNYRRSGSGPANGYWQYQVNGGAWNLIGDEPNEFTSTSTSGATSTAVSLNTITTLQSLPAGSVVDIRLTPYGATAAGGTFYFYGPVAGSDLVVTGTVATAVTATPLVLTGPSNYLELDPDNTQLDIWNETTDDGTIAQQLLLSTISSISYTGSTADDNLTVDFSNGNPLVSTGLTFDGGTGGNNSLTVVGTPGDDVFNVTASSVTFGSVPISFTNTTSLHIDGGAGSNTLTQAAQPSATLSLDDPTSQDVVNVQAGTFTIPAAAGTSDVTPVSLDTLHIESGATVNVAPASNHALRSALTLTTLEDAGTLNLADNDLILHQADYANILTALRSGRNLTNGYWNGTGITSSAAAGDTTFTTTLALIKNDDGTGNPLFGSSAPLGLFDGQTTVASDLLIKYTYYGDANLSGTVDGDDYSEIDYADTHNLTGWSNGDFNYDNTIDGSDYTLIDNAFNNQGPSLTPGPLPVIQPAVFSNWSAIQAAIAKVPQSAGQLASTSVINFGTTVYTGPLNVTNTLNRIRADNGPDRSDDGIVYTNPGASGLPSDGTYYEFTVEPAGGTNMNFSSTIASPGPMRILLATGGDCFFTGDHYSTFQPVFIYGQSSPVIATFAVNPTSVVAGTAVTLTATGVTETGGTVSGVKFYRETNNTTGLQTTGDTLVGSGTQSGTTWSIAGVSTTGYQAGSYTYYAVATDTNGFTSATSTTTLTVTGAVTTTGTVLAWNVAGQNGFGTSGLAASTVANGITNSTGLTRGTGISTAGTSAANAWGGSNWSTTTGAAGIAGNQSLTFRLTVGTGFKLSVSSVDLNYRRSTSGPANGFWQYEIGTGAWVTAADVTNEFPSTSTSGTAMTELNLSTITALQNLAAGTTVKFRLAAYGASTTGGTWYVYDLPGNDLAINGSITTS